MIPIKIVIYGTPVPQGSKRAFYKQGMKHAVVIEDNVKTKPWRQEIAGAAAEAMRKRSLDVVEDLPIMIACSFYFDRPKSLKKAITCKVTKPDVDKLTRTVLDGLTGQIFKDDGQVVLLKASKGFDQHPRAEISIEIGEHLPLFQS